MKTIDALERLGVGYHFEQEIAKFMDVLSRKPVASDDSCAVALQFRLLRQHHYDITCEVFKNFLDENGDFKDNLSSNIDALLSLYEAAHLSKRNEDMLNSAIVFIVDRLSSLANGGHLHKPIQDKVLHALAAPTHRRTRRLQAKLYISIYEDDNENNKDILELAKLDFHILQQMHRDEVKSISLWYKDLKPRSTLGPYIRERPVECYYWALSVFYEPQYSKARMMFAKLLILLSFFDDIFDSYGTLDEVRQFNQAVQSWDQEAARKIGKGYAYVMSHLSKTLEEFVAEDGASPVGIDCLKESVKSMPHLIHTSTGLVPLHMCDRNFVADGLKEASNCMLQEVVWREERQVPTVHDYLMQAAAISVLYVPVAVISFIGTDAKDEVFSWACSFPKIIEIAAIMCRLMDDIAGHENETLRSYTRRFFEMSSTMVNLTDKEVIETYIEGLWSCVDHRELGCRYPRDASELWDVTAK
ncbi:(-)-germacrene D synthase [Dichanthelium oligosanthes]|uniref:(-)-germacrene D synthase n=1 Tax=Dichanthelium oligosanthes TaxID=888268 RepID=A0A1E5UIJ4_9POAL|nr:(-)-germacrene D synthase [Dichanthelium oligosanthes]